MNTNTANHGLSYSSLTDLLPPAERAILAALMGLPEPKPEIRSQKDAA